MGSQRTQRGTGYLLMLAGLSVSMSVACSSTPQRPSAEGPTTPEPAPAATSSATVSPTGANRLAPGKPVPAAYFLCGVQGLLCAANTETCCHDNEPTCVPRGQEPETCEQRSECSTSKDCNSGLTCCAGSRYLTKRPHYFRRCQAKPCRSYELCRKGTCPQGQVCRYTSAGGPWDVGGCETPVDSSVACGKHTCKGDTPFCKWDGSAKTGTCVDLPTALRTQWIGIYQCDDDSDCPDGGRCWLGIADKSWCCRGDCFDDATNSKWTPCKTVKDCPKLDGFRFMCKPDPNLPPSIGRRCYPIYPPPP